MIFFTLDCAAFVICLCCVVMRQDGDGWGTCDEDEKFFSFLFLTV